MPLAQNRKTIAGSSIILTGSVFMFAAFATLSHVPMAVEAVYIGALIVGGGLCVAGSRQEAKRRIAQRESKAEAHGTV